MAKKNEISLKAQWIKTKLSNTGIIQSFDSCKGGGGTKSLPKSLLSSTSDDRIRIWSAIHMGSQQILRSEQLQLFWGKSDQCSVYCV